MKVEISTLIDAESESQAQADRTLERLRDDAELRETWEIYHLIGDSLRGTVGDGIGRADFAGRLQAEPTVLAPRNIRQMTRARVAKPPVRWIMPMAASLAAVAFVGWSARSLLMPEQVPMAQAAAPVAVAMPPVQVAEPGPSIAAVPVSLPPPAIPVAEGVDDYLWAHQRFSRSVTMQGVAPYVRQVAGPEVRQ